MQLCRFAQKTCSIMCELPFLVENEAVIFQLNMYEKRDKQRQKEDARRHNIIESRLC